MAEPTRQSYEIERRGIVPFSYALGLIVGAGVAKITEHNGVDTVDLRDGRRVEHWHADNTWRVLPVVPNG